MTKAERGEVFKEKLINLCLKYDCLLEGDFNLTNSSPSIIVYSEGNVKELMKRMTFHDEEGEE